MKDQINSNPIKSTKIKQKNKNKNKEHKQDQNEQSSGQLPLFEKKIQRREKRGLYIFLLCIKNIYNKYREKRGFIYIFVIYKKYI